MRMARQCCLMHKKKLCCVHLNRVAKTVHRDGNLAHRDVCLIDRVATITYRDVNFICRDVSCIFRDANLWKRIWYTLMK